MKRAKEIVITAVLTFLTLGAIVYTSCRPDHCKNMNCRNGGTCSDGFCTCPTGYTGTYCQIPNVSLIDIKNETFTPVTMTIGGAEYLIDSGETMTFTGSYGDSLKGTAKTHGLYGASVDIAPIREFFPPRNTLVHTLDVDTTYFFLMVTNTNSTVPEITKVYVNYKQRDSTLDIITNPSPIYNNGNTFHIGYFKAYKDTKVRLELTPNKYWTYDSVLKGQPKPLPKNLSYNAKLL